MKTNTKCLKCSSALSVRTSTNPTLQTCVTIFRCHQCGCYGKAMTEIVEFYEPEYREAKGWQSATKPLNQLDRQTVDMFAPEYTHSSNFKY
ncbi:hypothetical protein P9Z72_07610 [Glaesserella parasuis]|uniref:hypothetical protein n=1 Tax=Glaesserella parasuis TaxID=738 RepID=UPI0024365015|nr:hypothetical protein [Glaesserella parasuis]MDG6312387.1 hypothetical protein [Glaesserella parasuis]